MVQHQLIRQTIQRQSLPCAWFTWLLLWTWSGAVGSCWIQNCQPACPSENRGTCYSFLSSSLVVADQHQGILWSKQMGVNFGNFTFHMRLSKVQTVLRFRKLVQVVYKAPEFLAHPFILAFVYFYDMRRYPARCFSKDHDIFPTGIAIFFLHERVSTS